MCNKIVFALCPHPRFSFSSHHVPLPCLPLPFAYQLAQLRIRNILMFCAYWIGNWMVLLHCASSCSKPICEENKLVEDLQNGYMPALSKSRNIRQCHLSCWDSQRENLFRCSTCYVHSGSRNTEKSTCRVTSEVIAEVLPDLRRCTIMSSTFSSS